MLAMIQSLVILNSSYGDYVFTVGKSLMQISDSPVKKIVKNTERDDAYIVFLKDGNEIDIISDRVIIYNKVH
jgi:hypothetical protein